MAKLAEGVGIHDWASQNYGNSSGNQAWRDNFNDGWAAGDWTGNHNAVIAVEKAAESGQVVAVPANVTAAQLQAAAQRYEKGPEKVVVSRSDPTAPVVANAPGGKASGKPVSFDKGGTLTVAPSKQTSAQKKKASQVLTPAMEMGATQILIGGRPTTVNTGWSDAGEVEQRYGEAEFLSPGWFYNWGVTIADGVPTLRDLYLESPFAPQSEAKKAENTKWLQDNLLPKPPEKHPQYDSAWDAYSKATQAFDFAKGW